MVVAYCSLMNRLPALHSHGSSVESCQLGSVGGNGPGIINSTVHILRYEIKIKKGSRLQAMAPTRDHRRAVDIGHAGSKLKKMGKAAEKNFGRKIVDRLPAGEYVLLAKCASIDRHGAIRETWQVFGSEHMKSAVTHTLPQIKEAHSQALSRGPDPSLLVIPGTAEARAKRSRELLRQAWETHIQGTVWQRKKQMYKVVAAGGPGFPWWEEIAQVPFNATAVNDPQVSKRVCEYLARELYAREEQKFQHP